MLFLFISLATSDLFNICQKSKNEYSEDCNSLEDVIEKINDNDQINLLDEEYSPQETERLILEAVKISKKLTLSGVQTKLNFSSIKNEIYFPSITLESLSICDITTSFISTNISFENCNIINGNFINGLFHGKSQNIRIMQTKFINNTGIILNLNDSHVVFSNVYINNQKSNLPLFIGSSTEFQVYEFSIVNSSIFSLFSLYMGSLMTQNIQINQIISESTLFYTNYSTVSFVEFQISTIFSNSAIVFADCSNLENLIYIDMSVDFIVENYPTVFLATNSKSVYMTGSSFTNTTCRFGIFNNSKLDISHSTFSNNVLFAKRNEKEYSLITCNYCTGKITKCDFNNNKAPSCIMLTNSSINTRENKFVRNAGYYGTGIFGLYSNTSSMLDEFFDNQGKEGGALYYFQSQLRITDTTFKNNSGNNGGDIVLVGKISATFVGVTSESSFAKNGPFAYTNGEGKIVIEGCTLNYTDNGINPQREVKIETKKRRNKLIRQNATENIIGYGNEDNIEGFDPTLHDLILILLSFGLITIAVILIIYKKIKNDKMKRTTRRRKMYKTV